MKKTYAAILPLFFMASFGHAQSLSEEVKECGKIQDNDKRLACFDNVVSDLGINSGLHEKMDIPAPLSKSKPQDLTPVSVEIVKQVPLKNPASSDSSDSVDSVDSVDQKNDAFGLEHKRLYENTKDKVYVTISSVAKNQAGKRIFTLSNGHVWQQITAERFSAKTNQVVFIERGVLNSYIMGSDSFNKRTRIKRLK